MLDRALQSLCARGDLEKALDLLSHTHIVPSHTSYISLLKACKKSRSNALPQVKQVCAHLSSNHIPLDGLLGDYIVVTLSICGAVDVALYTLLTLPFRTVFSWTAVISAYAESGRSVDALTLYKYISEDGIQLSTHTFVSLFHACSSLRDVESGKILHTFACEMAFTSDAFVGNAIVGMYAECGALRESEVLFRYLSDRNLLSWNSMLSAFVANDQHERAMHLYTQMEGEDRVRPNHLTFVILFRSCSMLSLAEGQKIHAIANRKEFTCDPIVGTSLVSMYSNFKEMAKAEEVFCALDHHDVTSWNVMLSGYVKEGNVEKALRLYMQMLKQGVSPSQSTCLLAFQACASYAKQEHTRIWERSTIAIALEIGQALHSDALRLGFLSDPFLCNTLISMYGKCGAITDAECVFCTLLEKDIISWNAMLSAYVDCGLNDKALRLFTQIMKEGKNPDPQTYVIVLHGLMLASEESSLVMGTVERFPIPLCLEIGQALHTDADAEGFVKEAFVGSTILRMYGGFTALSEAESVFVGLTLRTVVSWNAMISAYVDCNQGRKALLLYSQMLKERVCPDQLTLTVVVKACNCLVVNEEDCYVHELSIKAVCLEIGQALHAMAWRKNFMSVSFINTLLCLYGKCGAISEAEKLFVMLSSHQTVVSYSAMMSAYVDNGQEVKALLLYAHLREEAMDTIPSMMIFALKACILLSEREDDSVLDGRSAKSIALDVGRALHADCQCDEELSSDASILSAVVKMYGKCGVIMEAEKVFSALHAYPDPYREGHENCQTITKSINAASGVDQIDSGLWNAMLTAYAEQGQAVKAIMFYGQMRKWYVALHIASMVSILKSCSSMGSLETCLQLHFDLVSNGYDNIPSVTAAVVHAYGNCSSMEEAGSCVYNLQKPDIVLWNACIGGYAAKGNIQASCRMFKTLLLEGIMPTESTFSSLLSACSQTGMIIMGFECFEKMLQLYAIAPQPKHFGSLLDILGRAGDFTRIDQMLRGREMQVDHVSLLSLLSACQTHGNIELAEFLYDHIVKQHPNDVNVYVLMSNIYVDIVNHHQQ